MICYIPTASEWIRVLHALDNTQSPPGRIDYLGDNVFQVVMTAYLGQPHSIIAPLVGRYFEKKGAQVDRSESSSSTTARAVTPRSPQPAAITHQSYHEARRHTVRERNCQLPPGQSRRAPYHVVCQPRGKIE